MNAISNALASAGVKLPPLRQRVWTWLKDHPGKMASDVAAGLGAEQTSVSTVLWDLKRRGMVSFYKDVKNVPGPVGVVSSCRYSALGVTYEFLPPAKKPSKVKVKPGLHVIGTAHLPKPVVVSTAASAAPASLAAPVHHIAKAKGPTTDVAFLLKQLSVEEALRLYNTLRDMFSQFKP